MFDRCLSRVFLHHNCYNNNHCLSVNHLRYNTSREQTKNSNQIYVKKYFIKIVSLVTETENCNMPVLQILTTRCNFSMK